MLDIVSTSRQLTSSIEETITKETINYSYIALENSPFFSSLKQSSPPNEILRYVFGQYRFWRDQFHTWFGLCI